MKFNKKKFKMMKEFEAKGITKSTVIQKSRATAVIQSNLDLVNYLKAKAGASTMTAKLVVNQYKRIGGGKKPSINSIKAMINYVKGDKIQTFLSNMGIEIKDLLADLLQYDRSVTEDFLLDPKNWDTVGAYNVEGPFKTSNGTVVTFSWRYYGGSSYTITGKKLDEKEDEKADEKA